MPKHFSLFKKRSSSAERIARSQPLEDEIHLLTNELVESSKKKLKKKFEDRIAEYNAKNNPLGEEEAKEILISLLREAAVDRRRLNAAIQRSVSEGTLYLRYYDKVAAINQLTTEAYVKMKRMQGIQERFEYKKLLYNNVTGNMYIKRNVSVAQKTTETIVPSDLVEAIDKVGGAMDEKEAFE